jgi:predicted secreted protein
VNHLQLSYSPDPPASGATELLGAVTKLFPETRRSRPLVVLFIAVMTLGLLIARAAPAQIINLPSGFASSNLGNNPDQIYPNNASYLSGSSIQIGDSTGHRANNAWYTTPVNVEAFTTAFTFHVDCSINPTKCGDAMGFMMISSSPSNPTYNPPSDLGFTYSGFSGAQVSWSQCQAEGTSCPFYNAMLIKFDLYCNECNGGSGTAGAEETGYYINGEYPQAPYSLQYDMSGSGIDFQSGDEFSCTITYNGSVLTETLTDTVTSQTYTISYVVDIPNAIGSSTALVGFGAGTGEATMLAYIDSWVYTVDASGASTPTVSPAAGTYSGAQSVTLAASTGQVICYSTVQKPQTNGATGCTAGTKYTGPVSVSSSETVYAVAGGTGYSDSIPIGAATYNINAQSSAPIVSLPSGSYSFPQTATISTTTTGTTTPVNQSAVYTCSTAHGGSCIPSTRLTAALTISSASTVCANATNTGFSTSPTVCYNYAAAGSVPASTTTLQASPTSANTGQTVALTATVSSQSGTNTPTGTVAFYDGSASLGTGALGSTGTATFSTTTLPAGSDSITASYGGDSNDASSTSEPVTVTIASAVVPTNTVVASSATAISSGQSVTFTATVSPHSGSNVPTGTVTFLDGATALGTGTLNASGVTMFSTSSLSVGTQSITASYAGDSNDNSSVSNAVSIVVTQIAVATTTMLTASATEITIGQSVTFTAKVVAQSGKDVPTGPIKFFDGTTSLGKASLNAGGTVALSTTALAAGTHSITASYFGNNKDSSSTSNAMSVGVTHSTVAATTTLTASAALITNLQSVTFTATVSPHSGSNVPTGTVTFLDGATALGTGTLNASGIAMFSTSSLSVGTQSITASYAGDSNDNSSVSNAVSIVVTQIAVATTTMLTASATEIRIGQSVTFTAKVVAQSGKGVPAGSIKFFDGTTSLGKASLNAGGTVALSTTALAAGTHSITASYFGNNKDSSSISNALSVVVTQTIVSIATTTTHSASATQVTTGQRVTFTACGSAQAAAMWPRAW